MSTADRGAPPARLSLVILAVHDVARAARFYEEAFGWAVAVDVPVYREYALPEGMRLGLYLREGFVKNTRAPVGLRTPAHTTATELYLTVDDPAAMASRLAALGARCLSPLAERPWGDVAAYFEDPEGNVVVVARAVATA
jgi:predicted enzyme related to lactoylglutathione lyase